ncbi:MAG: class II aldolase/adducin family protein [Pleurocapsa minor GSE-CHR-MK-17-07R]|jgi:L-fuculose-phosphate aldolase|nr:class II aldolase/adducin family protein [Pleurocapsa minor GSE-CHR-MK 17-07R]
MAVNEQALREQICQIGRLMHQNQYIDGAAGNITARLENGRVLATPSGLAKGFMSPDQLIVVDMDGNRVDEPNESNRELVPTSEITMHLECYKQRPDVNGVVHAHPQTAVALTLVGYDFQRCIIPEAIILLGLVPTTPYATPAGIENRDAIANYIREYDAIMLAHHGSLTVASTVWDAYMHLETLEHTAKILFMAEQLGGPRELPAHQVEKLLKIRAKLGLVRDGDAERFAEAMHAAD